MNMLYLTEQSLWISNALPGYNINSGGQNMITSGITKSISLICLLVFAYSPQLSAQQKAHVRNDWDESMEKRMEWWRDARYGMFIHWGLYSGSIR